MTESNPLPIIELDGVTWEPTLLHGDPGEKAWTKAMTTEHLALLLKGMPRAERGELVMFACDANGESRELFLSEVSRRLLDLSEKVLLLQVERADRAEAKLREMEGK